ncbi:hypothetical protein G3I59_07480 [Amycolatopsis rubida]|uniref:Uncharacterized protein n=1 Tax=Amycolatopsis rubida TaxID=112413 RepID=A0ABX0BJM9_9PSEU|nr:MULTISPECIES: hypothetical protein [Amycolatopsis]MYW90463.1 hypothetical protein [Amycolatopsis rubida]NEC55441.1 hypothetical protein [Amycolatopsis rubida]
MPVPCGEASLITAATTANAHPGSSIDLTEDCTYQLTAALPAITAATTVNGYHAILARTQTTAPFRILRGDAAGVGELVGSLPRVGAAEDVAPGRFFSQPECFRAFGDLLDQPPAAAGVPPRAGSAARTRPGGRAVPRRQAVTRRDKARGLGPAEIS